MSVALFLASFYSLKIFTANPVYHSHKTAYMYDVNNIFLCTSLMTASSVKIVISVHVQAHAMYLCMCMRCMYVPYSAKLQPTLKDFKS